MSADPQWPSVAVPDRHGADIETFGFLRHLDYSWMPDFLNIMLYYMEATNDSAPNWQHIQVSLLGRVRCHYSVCPQDRGYYTSLIDLEGIDNTMKYRDMVIDNYRKAGGDLRTLNRLGISDISNASAKECIYEAFRANNKPINETQLQELVVYVRPF
ncbi:hypothetical protein F4779DRAFT_622167 [Xylariaceae sp. FL0662B]|nr:hypothetical protein F4779DRAFT_622167 [Xylariaceae sp. FL0662B]